MRDFLLSRGILLALITLLLVFGVAHEIFNPWLRFDRQLIVGEHQWWRLWTCHLVHLNHFHLLQNMAGLLLLAWFFDDVLDNRFWMLNILVGFTFTGACLLWLNPELSRYVGLSGVLHGMFVSALIVSFSQTPWLNLLILLVVVGRILWEQQPGYDTTYLMDYTGGVVFVDAHLYGAMAGGLVALLLLPRLIRQSSANRE